MRDRQFKRHLLGDRAEAQLTALIVRGAMPDPRSSSACRIRRVASLRLPLHAVRARTVWYGVKAPPVVARGRMLLWGCFGELSEDLIRELTLPTRAGEQSIANEEARRLRDPKSDAVFHVE